MEKQKRVRVSLAVFLALGLVGGLMAIATAKPSEKCESDDPVAVATGTDGDASASVCVEDVGAVTAADKGEDGGYVIADGDSGSPLTAASPCLAGYAGVQVADNTIALRANGDDTTYNYPEPWPGEADPTKCVPEAPEPPEPPDPDLPEPPDPDLPDPDLPEPPDPDLPEPPDPDLPDPPSPPLP